MYPCSLQLIGNNNVYIPEPFEKNKNPDDSNKNIDEQLAEKDCSDDKSEFYPSSKECDTESTCI